MSKSLNEWGRFLALVLRHKPQAVDIELDVHGWAQVEALLVAFNRIEAFNMLMLEQIVAEDGKSGLQVLPFGQRRVAYGKRAQEVFTRMEGALDNEI